MCDFIKSDFLAANYEAIIALCALVLAVWQGLLQRRHNILSSAPHLTFDGLTQNISPQVKLTMTNHGLGPAFIESFDVSLDGVEMPMSGDGVWLKIASQLGLKITWGGGKAFNKGDALAAGQSADIFIFKTSEEKDQGFSSAHASQQLSRIGLTVKYRSAYNKRHVLKLNQW